MILGALETSENLLFMCLGAHARSRLEMPAISATMHRTYPSARVRSPVPLPGAIASTSRCDKKAVVCGRFHAALYPLKFLSYVLRLRPRP